jgi:hypothetical protein
MIFIGGITVTAREGLRSPYCMEAMFPCLLMPLSINVGINDVSARNPAPSENFHNSATRRFLAGTRWGDDFSHIGDSRVTESPGVVIILRDECVVNFSQDARSVSCRAIAESW